MGKETWNICPQRRNFWLGSRCYT